MFLLDLLLFISTLFAAADWLVAAIFTHASFYYQWKIKVREQHMGEMESKLFRGKVNPYKDLA